MIEGFKEIKDGIDEVGRMLEELNDPDFSSKTSRKVKRSDCYCIKLYCKCMNVGDCKYPQHKVWIIKEFKIISYKEALKLKKSHKCSCAVNY